MSGLQIPDYMQNKPVDVADLFDLQDRTRANQQAMKMNEMKMAEEQQTAPLRQRYMQSQAAENESTASINQLKAHQQKLALGSNIAKQILGQASKVAQEGTPEFEQAVQQYGNPLRPIMASAFGHENDPSKPIDVNGLKSLASMDIGEGNQDWVEINDVRGHFMMNKKNGEVKPVEHGGRQLQSPVYDIGTQYGISLSHKIPEEVAKGTVPLTSGPSIVQQGLFPSQQQPQARQQVYIDPNMSPEDQVTAQRDWANSQQGIANQNAQNGGVPAPSGGIKSDTQRLAEKQAIENENKPLAEGEKSSLNFATRMVEANDNFNSVEGKYSPEKLNLAVYTQDTPGLGKGINATLTPEEGSALQAKRQFINAVLRKESGAAIGIDEFKGADLQYFPQPGDSDKVIKQKEQSRKTAIQGFLIGIPEKHHPKPAVIIENKTENKPQSSGKIKFIGFD